MALIIAAGLVTLILFFDWNWFRPALEHYVSYKSHRIVKADDMQLEFSRSLQPTIRFRNLYVQNAPWSSQRPLVSAKEISFSFSAFRLPFSKKMGVVEISMSGAEVNLERLQDGSRNWRLIEPEYRGPGKYLVMALQANHSILRAIDHSTTLDIVAQSDPVDKVSSNPKDIAGSSAVPLSTQITFKGSYHGRQFTGEALTGQRLTFQKTGKMFPIQGVVHSGKTEMNVSGKVGDIFKDQIIDADIHFSSPSASALNPFMNTHLPDTHPVNAYSHLVKKSNAYHAYNLQGELGSSDIAGNLIFIHNENRSLLKGSLSSNETQLDDLTSMLPKEEGADATSDGAKPLVSRNMISTERLKSQDFDLSLNVHRLISPSLPLIENLSMKVDQNDGYLKIGPVHAILFGSPINAALSLNAQAQPVSAHIVVDAQNIALDKAFSKTRLHDMIAAPLTAHIDMSGTGDSLGEILDNASGKADFTVGHGEISNKLDAKMGLDLGKLVWLSIRGDKDIAVDHGAIHLDFKNGVGLSRDAGIATSQTTTQGTGSIDLRNETLDFLLTPKPKHPTIFSLRSNIRVYGPLSRPKFKIERKPVQ